MRNHRSVGCFRRSASILVELIVVLVILAILAAIMVPQLTGYIDKAKDKQYMVRARNIMIATQTLLDEEYATKTGSYTFADGSQFETDVLALAEESSTDDPADIVVLTTEANSYKIATMRIDFTGSKKSLEYQVGKWGSLIDTSAATLKAS